MNNNVLLVVAIALGLLFLTSGGRSIGAQVGGMLGGGGRDPYDREPNEVRGAYRAQSPFYFSTSDKPAVSDRYHR